MRTRTWNEDEGGHFWQIPSEEWSSALSVLFPYRLGSRLGRELLSFEHKVTEYKYELHFALLPDEWSCQTNNTSFQFPVLPLLPHFLAKRSCANWKWQAGLHVQQTNIVRAVCHAIDQSTPTPTVCEGSPCLGLLGWHTTKKEAKMKRGEEKKYFSLILALRYSLGLGLSESQMLCNLSLWQWQF